MSVHNPAAMKRTVLILIVCLFSTFAWGQVKKIAPDNKVVFKIKNAGVKVDGSFTGLTGTIVFDPKTLEKSYFDVNLEVKTINTDINARDNHLRKAEYFDAEKYPLISFKSKKIERTKTGFVTTGLLTIKGTIKEIKIPFSYSEANSNGLFNGILTLNRLDYKVGESSWILSDEVTIFLSIKVSSVN